MSIVCTVQVTQLNGEVSTTQLRFDSIESATVDSVKSQLGIPIRKKKDRDGAESVDSSLGGSNSSVVVGSPTDDETHKNIRLKIWSPPMDKYVLFKDLEHFNLLHDKNGGELTKFKIVKKKSKKSKESKEGKEKKKHKRTQSRDESADKKKDKSRDAVKKVDSKDSKDAKEKDHKDQKEHKEKKSSSWKGPMFGINLADVIDKQQQFLHNKSLVPLILFEITSYIRSKGGLKEEGLFRVSGSAQQVDDLRKLYDKKGSVDLNAQAPSIHSASSLLKQFFRELPEPLFPRRYYSTLIKVAKNPNTDSKINNLKLIVSKLPKINKHSLIYLLKFLKEVANHSDVNKMTPTNLGTVWGPNLIKEPPSEEPVNLSNFSQLMDSEHVNALICIMLDNMEGFEALKDDDDTGEVSTPIPPEHVPPPVLPGPSLTMPTTSQLYTSVSMPAAVGSPAPPQLTVTPPAAQSPQPDKLPPPNENQMKIKKELLQNVALKKTIVTFELGSIVRAKFDYAAQNIKMSNGETDISMKRGQEATVVENCPGGWVKVEMMVNDSKISGCVPCNYVTNATVPKLVMPPTSPLKPPGSPMDKRKSTVVERPTEQAPVTDFRSVLKKTEPPKKPEAVVETPKQPEPAVKLTNRPHSNTGPSGRQLSKAHSFVAHQAPASPAMLAANSPGNKQTLPVRPNSLLVEPASPAPPQLQSALQPPAVVEKALNAPPPASPTKQLSLNNLPTDQVSGSSDWREATTADGKKYYYNKRTRQTSWTVPDELVKASQAALPPPIIAPSPAPAPAPAKPQEVASPAPAKPEPTPPKVESAPPAPTHTSASDWKSAVAPNGKTYYYNVKTKETSWTKPGDEKSRDMTKSASVSSVDELERKLEEEEAEMAKQEEEKNPSSRQNENSLTKEDIKSLEEEEERLRIEEQLLEIEREEKMMNQQESDSSETSSEEEISDDDEDDEARIEELRRKLEEEEARIQEEQRRIQERKAQLLEEERKIREQAQKQKKKSKTKDEELPELPHQDA